MYNENEEFVYNPRKKETVWGTIILVLTEPPLPSNSWHKWALALRNSAPQMFALGYGADTHCCTCNISKKCIMLQSLELLMSVMHLPLHVVIHSETKWKKFHYDFYFCGLCGFKCVYIYKDQKKKNKIK